MAHARRLASPRTEPTCRYLADLGEAVAGAILGYMTAIEPRVIASLIARMQQYEAVLRKRDDREHAARISSLRERLLIASEVRQNFKAMQEAP